MQPPAGAIPQHPIDRGWAWMVCLGAFGLNFFINGGLRSMGILFIDLVIRYQANESLTSLTVAIMAGGFAIFSAIGNAVGAIKTMRAACMFGSIMMFLGMILTAFAPNIYIVILTLGLMSGIGYGFAFGPSMVMVGQYFVKRRSLANGLAAAGGSVGTLVLPLFIQVSSQTYGFQGTILIYSAIVLHAIPASMLLRPVAFYNRKTFPPGPSSLAVQQTSAAAAGKTATNGDQPRPLATVKDSAHYELVGSKIIAVPLGSSLESLPLDEPIVTVKETPAPAGGPPPAPPPGLPPNITLGMVLRMFCQKLCDREVIGQWAMIAFVIGLSIGHGGFITNCMFLPPYGFEIWKSKTIASYMIMILGLADLFGRVGGGWFADLGLVRKPFIIGFSFVGAGVSTIIFPFFPSFIAMVIYISVLGLLGGTYMAQMVVIVMELVGPAKTPSGLGFSTMVMGLAVIPLLPILSGVAKRTQTYSSALRLSGLLLVIGGIFFYLIPFLQGKQAQKKAKQQQQVVNGETNI